MPGITTKTQAAVLPLPHKDANAFMRLFYLISLLSFQVLVLPFPPLRDWLHTFSWQPHPCQITSATIKPANEHLQTYSPDIAFTYQFAGRQYSADKTHTLSTETNRATAQRTVNQYPPGRQTLCYVNPHNPNQAVLRRTIALDNLKEFEQFLLAVLIIPVLLYLLIKAVRFRRTLKRLQHHAAPHSLPDYLNTRFAQYPDLCLAPDPAPSTQILTTTFWCFWTGIFLFCTLAQLVSDTQSGIVNWSFRFFTLFLVAFFLYWLTNLFQAIVNSFHPAIHLRLTPFALHPNDSLQIHWKIPEHHRLKKLTLRVKGRCESPFFSPDLHDLFTRNKKFTLLETTNPAQIAERSAAFPIPENAEPTSDLSWDTWHWSVELRIKTSFLPSARLTYPFLVLPKPQETPHPLPPP